MRTKSEIKATVESAVAQGKDAERILQYIADEGYTYNDIASTSDMVSGYIMKGLQGLTMGHADEVAGGLLSFFSDKTYPEARDQIRNAEKLFTAANPVTATTAEVGGGFGTGVLGMAGKANTLMNMAKTGGTMGLASGHGYSEADDLKGKAIDTVTGGATGLALGAASKPVIEGGKAIVKMAGAPVMNMVTKSNPSKVGRDVIRDLNADGLSVDDVYARLNKLGDDGIVADVGGRNTMWLADHAANMPGKGQDMAQQYLTKRNLGQGRRISDGTAKITGKSQNYYDELDSLLIKRKEDATPLYDKYVNDLDNQVDMGKFVALIQEEPFLLKQIEKLSKQSELGLGGVPPNSIKFIDAIKKSLGDIESSSARTGKKHYGSLATDARKKLVSLADDTVPGYAEARKAFEVPTVQMELVKKGRDFLKGDVELVARDIAKMSPDQKEYFLSGVVRQIDEVLMSTSNNLDATKKIFGNDKKYMAIKAAFADDKKFKQFEKLITNEATMAKTKQILGGSPTMARQEKAKQASGGFFDGVMDVVQGNTVGAAKKGLNAISSGNKGYSPEELEYLSRIMFTPNGSPAAHSLKTDLMRKQGLLTLGDTGNLGLSGGLLGLNNTQINPAVTSFLGQPVRGLFNQ